jgi:ABC-type branched-subunit amino acid transport system substrate-binding protein
MGVVFEAEDTFLGRRVALKVPLGEVTDATQRQRFLREARIAATLPNDHIAAVYQAGEHNGVPFLAMELLRGESLEDCLDRDKTLPLADALRLVGEIAAGLREAHARGLVHRDIKPANIWLEKREGARAPRVKILDFGVAREARPQEGITAAGQIVGSVGYMAPEQILGDSLDARTDLFGLGCLFYRMVVGNLPFERANEFSTLRAIVDDPLDLQAAAPHLPPPVAALIGDMLQKGPNKRPSNTDAVIERLRQVELRSQPTLQLPGLKTMVPTPESKRRLPWGVLLGAAVVLLAGLAGLFALGKKLTGRVDHLPPVLKPDILFGMSGPFSGPSRGFGRDMQTGIETCFRSVNEDGGIDGRKLRLVAMDDGYEPDRAKANIRKLLDDRQVFGFIGNVGTPTTKEALPLTLERKRLFFGAYTGAPLLRHDPPDRYVFNYRASYAEETAAIVSYLRKVKGIAPGGIAVFAQNDDYGNAGFEGVARALRMEGHDSRQTLRVGYQRNARDVGEAALKMLAHRDSVRAVVMVATYRPAALFIKRLKDEGMNVVFTNVSFVGSNALADSLHEVGADPEGVIVTQVVPHFLSNATVVSRYRELLAKYSPAESPGFVSLEGYIAATILTQALRSAGENLTTDNLVDELEKIRGLDLGIGTKINFGPSEHQGSHKVWGTILNAKGEYQALDLE